LAAPIVAISRRVKATYVMFQISNGVALVEQPVVRGSDGVEVWEVLPTRCSEFMGRSDGWYWQRRTFLDDRDAIGFPAVAGFRNALHGPFENERAAREDMEEHGAVRASVHWPTTGDPLRGYQTMPPKEFEAGYVATIDLDRDQWLVVEGDVAAAGGR
jgi:hypothetical protein